MRLFGRKARRTENIVVYYLSAIVDGDARSTPLGAMARLTEAHERHLKQLHKPKDGSYFNEQMGGCTVMCYWSNGGIDALCFLSGDEARAFPGITIFSPNDIAALDPVLRHFPRQ